MSQLLSVNVGTPRDRSWSNGTPTAIEKVAVTTPVRVELLGVDGDQVGDTRHHGGPDQAVYAYAREDLDWWEHELGREIPSGWFGENLTTEGLDLTGTEIGTRWRIGDVVLEVASVRIPCNTFKGWMGSSGYDDAGWVKRFTRAGRPGPYLRVVEPGTLQAGDPIEVIRRPGHGVTVSTMFAATTTDRSRLPELLAVDGLVPKVRAEAEAYLAGAAGD